MPWLALLVAMVAPVGDAPSWDAPAGCPSAAEVESRIRALAGRLPEGAELRVRARVVGPPWAVQLELAREQVLQARTFAADTCDELADVVAVVVAVALDPVGVAVRVETSGAGEPRVPAIPDTRRRSLPRIEPTLEQPAVAAPVSTNAPARVTRAVPLRLALRVAGGGEIGATPRGTGGVELALAFTRGRFGVELQGRYWARRRHDVAAGASLTAELGTIGVRGCYVGTVTRVRIGPCIGLETGDYVVRAFGVRNGQRAHIPWLAASLGGALSITLREPVSLWLGVEGAVNIFRPRAVLDPAPQTSLHHVGSVGMRALAGLELRLFGRPGANGRRSPDP